MNEDTEIQSTLDPVYLYRTDAEKGEGVDLAKEYKIRAYPSFVLLNGESETVDRWVGYEKNYLIRTMNDVMSDLSTIDEKMARYKAEPTAKDAEVLGRYSNALGDYKNAVGYYANAQAMTGDKSSDYTYQIFTNTAYGIRGEDFTFDDAVKAARDVMNSPLSDPQNKISVAMRITDMAKQNDNLDIVPPFIEEGLKLVSGSEDPEAIDANNNLMVRKALYVTHDNDEAVKYKKLTMPEGWTDDAGQLNSFAWWCFENSVDLKEAEKLARKGVDLAKPGREKAMILDTLAEICNVLNNCSESVDLTEAAIKEDPDNEYYQKQLERFQGILASGE